MEFQVPSGQLFFTGSEYAFRDDRGFLDKHSHMGSSVDDSPRNLPVDRLSHRLCRGPAGEQLPRVGLALGVSGSGRA